MIAALLSGSLISGQAGSRVISGQSRPAPLSDRIRHFECYSIVRIVAGELARLDEADVIGSLTKHCQKLRHLQKDVCNDIVSKRLPEIRFLLQQKKRPDQVCDAIGYNRSFLSGHTVSKRFCGIIVNRLRSAVRDNTFKPWRKRLRVGRDGSIGQRSASASTRGRAPSPCHHRRVRLRDKRVRVPARHIRIGRQGVPLRTWQI